MFGERLLNFMPRDLFSLRNQATQGYQNNIAGLGTYNGTAAPNNPTPSVPSISNILNSALPGIGGATNSAVSYVSDMLNGLPSPSNARRINAYGGAASGMPGSEFVRNRGYDIYGQQAEQRKSQGFRDLLALLSGGSGILFPNVAQQQSGNEFGQQQGLNLESLIAQAYGAKKPGVRLGLGPTTRTGLT